MEGSYQTGGIWVAKSKSCKWGFLWGGKRWNHCRKRRCLPSLPSIHLPIPSFVVPWTGQLLKSICAPGALKGGSRGVTLCLSREAASPGYVMGTWNWKGFGKVCGDPSEPGANLPKEFLLPTQRRVLARIQWILFSVSRSL